MSSACFPALAMLAVRSVRVCKPRHRSLRRTLASSPVVPPTMRAKPVARHEAGRRDGRSLSLKDVPGRETQVQALGSKEFDVLVIGGGATGCGCAVDAAARGLSVALVEREDFSSGTSSRSTKLIHGGVRYLEKAVFNLDWGQYKLVREALFERNTLMRLAPHLSRHIPILIPVYTWWKLPYYYAGLIAYDIVAGRANKHRSYLLSKRQILEAFPMLNSDKLVGGVVYYDGQQNDARVNVTLAMTAAASGAVVANYVNVESLVKRDGRVRGALVRDVAHGGSQGTPFEVRAKCVINAAGPFTDSVRAMDDAKDPPICAPSSGAHIMLPRYFCNQEMGLLDPETSDARVVFCLPWEGGTLVGTTDENCDLVQYPVATEDNIEFIMKEFRKYLNKDTPLRRQDVTSAWSGIRPLVKDPKKAHTQEISREHVVHTTPAGVVTVAGGKWTTYRAMAEDAVNAAEKVVGAGHVASPTAKQPLMGAGSYSPMYFVRLVQEYGVPEDVARHLAHSYGDQALHVVSRGSNERGGAKWTRLSHDFPYIEEEIPVMVQEYTRSIVDVIARRTRIAFLDVEAAAGVIPRVSELLARELRWDSSRQAKEVERAHAFLKTMIGRVPAKTKPLPPKAAQ